jgi:hypothetical protein
VVQTEPHLHAARPARRADRDLHLLETQLDALLSALSVRWLAPWAGADQDHAHCMRVRAKRSEVSRVLQASPQLIEPVAEQLMDAVLHDINPSFNRLLIEPLLRVMPACATLERLIDVIETGPRRQKICAAHAAYWVWALGVRIQDRHEFVDVIGRLREASLRAFVEVDDLGVRRALDSWVSLDPARYPDRLHPLVRQAEQIARAEPASFSGLLLAT